MGVIGSAESPRNVDDLARGVWDLVVVGGGIYGAMVHLEAARAGLRSLLVERGDFGGATSASSLRIVHGGLRYLKDLDVARSIESTRERQWYLAALPHLVEQLPCLLPLYGKGSRRVHVLKAALAANDAIAAAVRHVDSALADVPRGYVLDAGGVLDAAPAIPADGLVGGAVWHDLTIRCPGRVIVEALRWAADLGGVAVNYCEAEQLVTTRGQVRGVAIRSSDGTEAEIRTRVVINTAGPWAGELAGRWGDSVSAEMPLLVAWNVLLERPALSAHAVALQDRQTPSAPLKFATSLAGRLFVGTGYAPFDGRDFASASAIAERGIDEFLAGLNRCVPSLSVTRRDVARIYSGVLPAAAPGSTVPRARNEIHGRGPHGLITISGTKFTTARAAARKALALVRRSGLVGGQKSSRASYQPCHTNLRDGLFGNVWTIYDIKARRDGLAKIIETEAVEHLDDLVLRRTTLGDQPARALMAARALCRLDERWSASSEREVARLAVQLHGPREIPYVPPLELPRRFAAAPH